MIRSGRKAWLRAAPVAKWEATGIGGKAVAFSAAIFTRDVKHSALYGAGILRFLARDCMIFICLKGVSVVDDDIKNRLPRHIAIIMDGNGRWAKLRGLPRTEGHRAGAGAVRAIVTECRRLGIGYLTLYAFSSENWNRPPTEIAALFSLLLEFLRIETQLMVDNGIRLNVIGDIDGLPAPQRAALRHSMARTAEGKDMRLNLALNYGGRAEIVRAVKSLLASGARPEDVTEESFAAGLYTEGQPDPDFLIRTSGEQRLSNYLLYQCAYSELYFTPVLWPDFDAVELGKALSEYSARSRRFGRIEE